MAGTARAGAWPWPSSAAGPVRCWKPRATNPPGWTPPRSWFCPCPSCWRGPLPHWCCPAAMKNACRLRPTRPASGPRRSAKRGVCPAAKRWNRPSAPPGTTRCKRRRWTCSGAPATKAASRCRPARSCSPCRSTASPHNPAAPRCPRRVAAAPTARPSPQGQALPLQRLSATAYADLRHCPYRFFALRQLGLQEADELAADIDKRDFGNWLHAVLQHFHEALRDDPAPDDATRSARMDSAAQAVTRQQGRDEGDFLPFTAGWPPLRDGYLRWLAQHEQAGARFRQAEWHTSQPLDPFDPSGTLDMVQLVGTIDRIDTLSSTDGPGTLVSDRKSDIEDARSKYRTY